MLIRKLRIQRGWTQSQLAELAGVTIRTVQRLEKGHSPSMETCKALASVFEVDFSTFYNEDKKMESSATITHQEQVAILKASNKKAFYEYLYYYLFFAIVFIPLFVFSIPVQHTYYVLGGTFGGLGIYIVVRGLVAYEVFNFLTPDWEKRVFDKELDQK